MRKLITFAVILIAIMAIMDHVHVPPNKALADVKHSVTQKETSKKTIEPTIEAATFTPPKYVRENGCEQYRKLVSGYNWNVRVFMAVMEAESFNRESGLSCDSSAVGDRYPIAGVLAPSCGLMQVRTIAAWRGTCDQLKDPEFNLDVAYRIYQGQGMAAWSTYTNGAYLKYLR